jgi:hypothetical protein
MRKAEFLIPSEAMVEFTDEMANRDLAGTVSGTTDEDEIILEVEYEKDESDQVDELEAILDKLKEQIEEDDN